MKIIFLLFTWTGMFRQSLNVQTSTIHPLHPDHHFRLRYFQTLLQASVLSGGESLSSSTAHAKEGLSLRFPRGFFYWYSMVFLADILLSCQKRQLYFEELCPLSSCCCVLNFNPIEIFS